MIALRALLLAALFVTASCGSKALRLSPSPQDADLQKNESRAGRIQLDVPFYSEPAGLCGPAALASVLGYWGLEIPPERIAEAVLLPRLKGALPFDLAHFARQHGMRAMSFRGDWDKLEDRLSQGIPLIAFLNKGNVFFKAGHFLVVTGIDRPAKRLWVHSGPNRNQAIPFEDFLSEWKGGDYWTLEVTPTNWEPRQDRAATRSSSSPAF